MGIRPTRSRAVRKTPSRPFDLSANVVMPLANDRVWQRFEQILKPDEVARILKGAINGDPLEQDNLFNIMVGTWPDLGQALNQVCDEAARAPLTVQPFAEEGEETTPSAEDKAATIQKLKRSMRPISNTRRTGWHGTVRELAMGYFYGLTIREIHWDVVDGLWLPTDTEELSPIFYRYPLHGSQVDQVLFSPNGRMGQDLVQFDPNKFLVGEKRWHRGGTLQTAPLRALVPYWIAAVYGLKWFLQYGQVFGVPFRFGTYREGDDQARIALNNALQNIGTAGWASGPDGTKIDITPIPSGAQSLPQKELITMANNAVAKFILGQTLTSDVGDSGSRALGDVHESIRRSRIESAVAFAAEIFNFQLVPAIIRANYPDEGELPYIQPDWPDDEDALKKVERDEKLFSGSLNLPVALKDVYDRHGVRMPEEGEELFTPSTPSLVNQESDPGDVDGVTPGAQPESGSELGRAPSNSGEEDEEEGDEAQAQRAKGDHVKAAATLNTATLEALQENVAAMVPNVAREWLDPAADFFRPLVSMALEGKATPAEFERVLVEAAATIPDLELNTGALEEALVMAVGTAMLAGAGQKAIDLPVK